MSNTLAQVGAQALPRKLMAPATGIKWLAFGCIIADPSGARLHLAYLIYALGNIQFGANDL